MCVVCVCMFVRPRMYVCVFFIFGMEMYMKELYTAYCVMQKYLPLTNRRKQKHSPTYTATSIVLCRYT